MPSGRQTTNYLDLILPKGSEYYSVQDGNLNFTILDSKIEEIVNNISSLNDNMESSIEQAVSDIIGGSTEGIDSLKDILDLLNDPESGELVKINEAINQRVTNDEFSEFKTEHTKVHDTLNTRLSNIDDGSDGLIVKEQTARQSADTELSNKIGSLNSLSTSSKTNVVNSINEVVGNIGPLSSLATSSKTNIVNAINNVKTSVDNLESNTDELNRKNGYYTYNLKNVLLEPKGDSPSDNDLITYSKSGNKTFHIKFNNFKLFYYGTVLTLNDTITITAGEGTYCVYIAMVNNGEVDDIPNDDKFGYVYGTDGYLFTIVNPIKYKIEFTNTYYTNTGIVSIEDTNSAMYIQPLFFITIMNYSPSNPNTDNYIIHLMEWCNGETLPSIYDTEYHDYVTGIYNIVRSDIDEKL